MGMPVTFANSIEIPVTPPSINRDDSRNPFMPIAADSTPKTIWIKLSTWTLNFTRKYTTGTYCPVKII